MKETNRLQIQQKKKHKNDQKDERTEKKRYVKLMCKNNTGEKSEHMLYEMISKS